MSQQAKPGKIVWQDLTVADAPGVRDFYSAVVGWTPGEVPMKDYADYTMSAGDTVVGGVCHARGINANVPSAWLIYISVESVSATLARAVERGGSIVDGPRTMGDSEFAVIRDPAGAVFAIIGPK